jgi:hypothetical protein
MGQTPLKENIGWMTPLALLVAGLAPSWSEADVYSAVIAAEHCACVYGVFTGALVPR